MKKLLTISLVIIAFKAGLYAGSIHQPYALTVEEVTPGLVASCRQDENCMDINSLDVSEIEGSQSQAEIAELQKLDK